MSVLEVGPVEDGVVVVTLNRPDKRNALSIELRDATSDALDRLAGDDAVRVVIVTGAGDVFCAGFDLGEFQRMDDPEIAARLWPSSDRYHRTCIDFPLPLIAAVNGPAIAGGFDLAVMCDIRVASERAAFAHPEITFGDVVYGPLHDLVGGAVARELCLTGRRVDAVEALSLRLVSTVVPHQAVVDEARRYAAMITQAPRDVLVRTKAKIARRAGVSEGGTLNL
ncbi:MAG TPA: enoyl-CoA hydratase/isomerase family protein [Acidimicrobiales bacterium]|nr:enoyl-CoA hydratase/isomerase family protein [Acidimicrobiales bacterium]